jgi:hypothetical protein
VRHVATEIPVVLCVWRRLDRLRRTLELLAAQRRHRPRLYVWNNNVAARREVRTTTRGGWPFAIQVHDSPVNVGGFGRFLTAREIARTSPRVVFLDDDLDFGDDLLSTMAAEHRPSSLTAWWAFRIQDPADYWVRRPLDPGDEADYCGTGGMICDTRVFRRRGLFQCPSKYAFLEDLWLSFYVGHRLGWKKYKSAAAVREVRDGANQVLLAGVYEQKSEFLGLLTGPGGWRLIGDRAGA